MPHTFRYGDADSQVGDLYLPVAGTPRPVICLLHGGFWRLPYGREEMAPVAADLAARGYAAWNIEYRRIGEPGGGWPGAAEDVAAAIDHLAVLADRETRLDLGRVAVVGHSAGGHLALCAGARGGNVRRPAPSKVVPLVVCGLAAVADLHEALLFDAGDGAVSSLLGGSPQLHAERYEQASPRHMLPLGVRQLILHGSEDDALPPRLSRAYVQAARGAGDSVDYIELPGMGHMEYLDPGSRAHAHMCNWLGVMLADRKPGA